MKIEKLMSTPSLRCSPDSMLKDAAKLMWDGDVGFIPVVDDKERVVGVITDRDIAMASYLKGRPLDAIPVSKVMSKKVITCASSDEAATVESLFEKNAIHRMPVVNESGQLRGVISIGDLLRAVDAGKHDGIKTGALLHAMAAVCTPRPHPSKEATKAKALLTTHG